MNRTFIPVLMLLLLLGGACNANAQRSTERYIPLGQSPGVSGKVTLMGTVGGVAAGTVIVQSAAGAQHVKLTNATRLWLDRSAAQQPTTVATVADLRAGRRVEVKFSDDSARTTAEWIKIDAAAQ